MRDSYGGIGRIHVLSARAAGPEDVDAQLGWIDLDFHLIRLRKNGHGNGRGMDPALRFRLRYALDAVDAGFKLEPAEDALSLYEADDLLQSPQSCEMAAQNLHLPLFRLGVLSVHTEKIGGKQGGFFSAGPGTDLQENVFLVVGVFGQEEERQFLFGLQETLLQILDLGPGQLPEFLLLFGEQFLVLLNLSLQVLVPPIDFEDLLEMCMLLRDPPVFGLVLEDLACAESFRELLKPLLDFTQVLKHHMASGVFALLLVSGREHRRFLAGRIVHGTRLWLCGTLPRKACVRSRIPEPTGGNGWVQLFGVAFPYFRKNRSTLPSESTSFCLPVKNG